MYAQARGTFNSPRGLRSKREDKDRLDVSRGRTRSRRRSSSTLLAHQPLGRRMNAGSPPPSACHVLAVQCASRQDPAIRFFTARDESGDLLGCGSAQAAGRRSRRDQVDAHSRRGAWKRGRLRPNSTRLNKRSASGRDDPGAASWKRAMAPCSRPPTGSCRGSHGL